MGRQLLQAAKDLDRVAQVVQQEAVRSLRRDGLTYRDIAKELGISKSRAQQLDAEPVKAPNDNGNGKRRKP